jgi:hypothetical protein
MALRSLIVKIGADTASIDKALASVGESAKTLDAGLKKLGNTPLGKQAQQDAERLQKSLDAVRAANERIANSGIAAGRGVEAIGGPARLTTNQLAQMNRTIQQSLDAFRALGQQAPAELRKIAAAIQAQQKALQTPLAPTGSGGRDLLGGLASSLPGGNVIGGLVSGGAIGATAAGGAFAFAAKSALDYADSLTKLSDQTRIGTEDLQQLETIALASGNTLEQVAKASSQFQRLLSEGNKDQAKSLGEIGLSVEQLRSLAPQDQLIAIAKGFQEIKNPADEARIATDLFGRTGLELIPTLKAEIDGLRDSTVTASADSIAALDAWGDSFGGLTKSAKAAFTETLGQILRGNITLQQQALDRARQELEKELNQRFVGPVLDPRSELDRLSGLPTIDAAEAIAETEKILGTSQEQLRKAVAASDAILERHRQQLDAVNQKIAEAIRPLQDLSFAQQELILRYREFGLSTQEIALKLGISARVVETFTKGIDTLRGRLREIESGGGILRPLLGSDQIDAAAELAPFFALMDRIESIQNGSFRPAIDPSVLTGPLPSLELIKPEVPETLKAAKNGLDDIARSLAQLAQISGDSFGGILQGISRTIAGLDVMSKSLKTLKNPGAGVSGLLNQISAGLSIGIAAFDIGKQIFDAFHDTEAEKIAHDIGRDLGQSISEGLSAEIENTGKALADAARRAALEAGDIRAAISIDDSDFRGAATALNLDKIIGEAGGVRDFGFNKAVEEARRLFSIIDDGNLTVEQVGGTFDRVFAKLAAESISKFSKLATSTFVELQQTALRFGVESPELDRFRAEQVAQSSSGLDRFLSNATVSTQGGASGVAGAIAAQFGELQRQGLPLLDIFKQLGPNIDAFQKQLTKTGFEGSAAFNEIAGLADLASDKIAGPALESVAGLQQVLAGLGNIGGLDASTFSGLSEQIGSTFQSLVNQGKDADQVFRLMAPSLQTIFELQQRTGFAVDETTQNLIAQAKAKGLVGDQFKSADERQVDGLNRTNTILEAIANKLGAVIPAAAQAGAQGVENAFSGVDPGGVTDGVERDLANLPGAAQDAAGGVSDALGGIKQPRILDDVTGDLTRFVDEAGNVIGTVGDGFADLPADGAAAFRDLLDAYRAQFGEQAPELTTQVVDEVNQVLEGIKTDFEFRLNFDVNAPSAGFGRTFAASGGLVTPFGIQHFDGGGRVLPFLRRGTDSVPAMLTPGEIVLNDAQQDALGDALASRGSVVNVDARGAFFGERGVEEGTRKIRQHLDKGGTEATKWRKGGLRRAG